MALVSAKLRVKVDMQVSVFSARLHDRQALEQSQGFGAHSFNFLEARLDASTVTTAAGVHAVCAFVHDQLDRQVLQGLKSRGVRLVVRGCAGFNQVDLVADHTLTLLLMLNRKIHRAKPDCMAMRVQYVPLPALLARSDVVSLGLDVYEEEGGLFFRDLSSAGIQDDVFTRLLTFPNVLFTGQPKYPVYPVEL